MQNMWYLYNMQNVSKYTEYEICISDSQYTLYYADDVTQGT